MNDPALLSLIVTLHLIRPWISTNVNNLLGLALWHRMMRLVKMFCRGGKVRQYFVGDSVEVSRAHFLNGFKGILLICNSR